MTDSEDCQEITNNREVPTRLIELAKATFEPVKAENYRRIAEAWGDISAHRKVAGKETYNAKRKREYAEAALAEGRTVRAYRIPASEEKKAQRTAANTLRMRNKRHGVALEPMADDTLSDEDIDWLADRL